MRATCRITPRGRGWGSVMDDEKESLLGIFNPLGLLRLLQEDGYIVDPDGPTSLTLEMTRRIGCQLRIIAVHEGRKPSEVAIDIIAAALERYSPGITSAPRPEESPASKVSVMVAFPTGRGAASTDPVVHVADDFDSLQKVADARKYRDCIMYRDIPTWDQSSASAPAARSGIDAHRERAISDLRPYLPNDGRTLSPLAKAGFETLGQLADAGPDAWAAAGVSQAHIGRIKDRLTKLGIIYAPSGSTASDSGSAGEPPPRPNRDPLYDKAIAVVRKKGEGSASTLQRVLQIGYGRASRMIDMMEADGIVGPARAGHARELLNGPRPVTRVKAGDEAA